jgi:hypothetical protein
MGHTIVQPPHALDLREQIRWVNGRFLQQEAGYAAEVHKNAAGPGATGVEAWYVTGNSEAGKKAETVLGELARISRLRNRGIKKDVDYSGGSLAWVRQTRAWAGLFECGFISEGFCASERAAKQPAVKSAYSRGVSKRRRLRVSIPRSARRLRAAKPRCFRSRRAHSDPAPLSGDPARSPGPRREWLVGEQFGTRLRP